MKDHFPASNCWDTEALARYSYDSCVQGMEVSPMFLELFDACDPQTDITAHDRGLFFDLRTKVEREEPFGINYLTYGRQLWDALLGEQGEQLRSAEAHPDVYQQFLVDLIRGHVEYIPMKEMMFAEVPQVTGRFVEELLPIVKKVNLWSMGDVRTCGYQALKIASTGLIQEVQQLVRQAMEKGASKDLAVKLGYLVSEQKKEELYGYMKLRNQEVIDEPHRFVVLDDSLGNLQAIERFLEEQGLDRVVFTPIWASYSRRGQELKATDPERYDRLKNVYHGIDSLTELFGEEFRDYLRDAELYVDWDGVIVDNVEQRHYQARVKYAALASAKKTLQQRGVVL